jgi:eukaryotic-like serine/threonine-protein kinase
VEVHNVWGDLPQEAISDRCELLEELSHGGMGDVWRGDDAVLDRPVAVKLIRQASVTSPQLAEEFAKRFRREARITARIQHPACRRCTTRCSTRRTSGCSW